MNFIKRIVYNKKQPRKGHVMNSEKCKHVNKEGAKCKTIGCFYCKHYDYDNR